MTHFFVGNLAYAATERDVAVAFNAVGVYAQNIRIIVDHTTQRPRGFAFFDADGDPQTVIDTLTGLQLHGRAIRVALATRQQREAGTDDSSTGYAKVWRSSDSRTVGNSRGHARRAFRE